jgi:hypothetical protein
MIVQHLLPELITIPHPIMDRAMDLVVEVRIMEMDHRLDRRVEGCLALEDSLVMDFQAERCSNLLAIALVIPSVKIQQYPRLEVDLRHGRRQRRHPTRAIVHRFGITTIPIPPPTPNLGILEAAICILLRQIQA